MSRRRQKRQGQARVLYTPPSRLEKEIRGEQNGAAVAEPGAPVAVREANGAAVALAPAVRAGSAEDPPPSLLPAPALSPEALSVLAGQMARFQLRLEELLSRERPGGRSPDERKETWVLLGALTLVVAFCFVAFYLNQSEMRELQSGLQEDIDRVGRTASTSLERTLGGFHLERLPEVQAAVERLLKDKDHRDTQRFGEVLGEVQRQALQGGARLREDLRAIEDQLAGLRQLSEEIHQLQVEVKASARSAPPEEASSRPAPRKTKTAAGRAARASDGELENLPPDPAAGPPGAEAQSGGEKEEGQPSAS